MAKPQPDPSAPLPKAAWEAFAHEVAKGASAAEAYRKTFPRASRATAETEGPATLRVSQVRLRVDWLRRKAAERPVRRTLLEISRKREICAEIAEDCLEPLPRLKAIQVDNDLAGEGSEARSRDALTGALAGILGLEGGDE